MMERNIVSAGQMEREMYSSADEKQKGWMKKCKRLLLQFYQQ